MPNNSSNSISVVIATYNGATYLAEQLSSIVSQTIQPYEVIIRDDCSNDDTVNIIESYRTKLHIRYYQNARNVGYTKNFELAVSSATGSYIALCDQDDIWEPHKLEQLLKRIEGYSLVFSNSALIDATGNLMGKTLSQKLRNRFIAVSSPLSFVYDNCVSAHAMLFQRSLISHLLPFPHHLFFDAWIAANAASVSGINYIGQSLVRYRQHSSNTLSKTKKTKTSLFNTIVFKAAKKLEGHKNSAGMISDLLLIPTLSHKERSVLEQLKREHLSFEMRWFNFTLFLVLVKNRKLIFAITEKNPWSSAFKKAIGFKFYRLLPFL